MAMLKTNATTIDEFMLEFPPAVRKIMETVRTAIRKAAPQATEKISYAIPTFYLNGNLVHFSAYKTHIGFYPGSKAIAMFKKELSGYKTSKGTVQFPLDEPMPLALITKITKARVKENLAKGKKK